MTRLEALKLVLELAQQNMLDDSQCDTPELVAEQKRQARAICKVAVMIVNREAAAAKGLR